MENQDVRIRITIAGSYAYYPLLRMLFAKYQIANCPQTVSKTLTKQYNPEQELDVKTLTMSTNGNSTIDLSD